MDPTEGRRLRTIPRRPPSGRQTRPKTWPRKGAGQADPPALTVFQASPVPIDTQSHSAQPVAGMNSSEPLCTSLADGLLHPQNSTSPRDILQRTQAARAPLPGGPVSPECTG